MSQLVGASVGGFDGCAGIRGRAYVIPSGPATRYATIAANPTRPNANPSNPPTSRTANQYDNGVLEICIPRPASTNGKPFATTIPVKKAEKILKPIKA